jgi:drug/metabolite transporter (DMT)-like permease
VLLVSYLAKMERMTPSLIISVSLISIGIIVAAATSTDFNTVGMLLVLIAAMLGGVRLVYVQYILQPKKHQHNYEQVATETENEK